MTADAEDAALMLSAMAGFDSKDSTSERDDNWLRQIAEHGIADLDRPLTIGLPKEYYRDLAHGEAIEAVQRFLASRGTNWLKYLPHTHSAIPTTSSPELRRRLIFRVMTVCVSDIALKNPTP